MSETDVNQLQLLQQNLHNLLAQKQQFQNQLLETDSAIQELQTSPQAYKIVGNIMISTKKEDLIKELTEKKEILDLRVKTIEKQEQNLKEQAEKTQQKIVQGMKHDRPKTSN